jgi:hypothetical protein
MARVVGEKLMVNVSRKPAEEQIVALVRLFNDNPNRILWVVGTVAACAALVAAGAPASPLLPPLCSRA